MSKRIWGLSALALLFGAVPVQAGEVLNDAVTPGTDTMVYGAAAMPGGGEDAAIVAQPADAANPLGAPIVDDTVPAAQPALPVVPATVNMPAVPTGAASVPAVNQVSEQNPSISSEPNPAEMNNKIQDTLYESGGRIYDIQSYPAEDIKKLESPEQPTIENYPAY